MVFPLLAVSLHLSQHYARGSRCTIAQWQLHSLLLCPECLRVFFPLIPPLFSMMYNWRWTKECRSCPSPLSWRTVLLLLGVTLLKLQEAQRTGEKRQKRRQGEVMQHPGERFDRKMKHRSSCCEGIFLIYAHGLPATMLNAVKSV